MPVNRIKELAARMDLTPSDVARLIDPPMQPHALRRYTRINPKTGLHDGEPKVALAQKIAKVLNCTYEEVLGLTPSNQAAAQPTIPLYGAAMGGIGYDISDVTDPIDRVATPPWLIHARDCYAVNVIGDSMEPRYYAGEQIYVSPNKAPAPGDFVVVQIREDHVHKAIVKRLVQSGDEIVLEQLNPATKITYQVDEVKSIHVVTGSRSRVI